MRGLMIICLFLLSSGLKAQKSVEAGYSLMNFTASILNNQFNSNKRAGQGFFVAYTDPVGVKTNIVYRALVGQFLNLSNEYKAYAYGNFASAEIELRQSVLSKTLSKYHVKLEPSIGYGFAYIPVNKDAKYRQVTSTVSPGFNIQYRAASWPLAVGFQSTWNQRLNTDFRTYLQFKPSIIFTLDK